MEAGKRLEWAADVVEIQQLAYRYAIAADSKNVEMMASLYAEGVEEKGVKRTREQLRARFANSFSQSPLCILNVGNHLVDMDPNDPDRAGGTVYCRAEVEWGDIWLIQQIVYIDRYIRRDGRWLFYTRKHLLYYGADKDQRPSKLPPSDAAELTHGKGSMPQYWESYREFWRQYPDSKHY